VSDPLVSFVMPVWNPRGDWLLAAVRSVLEQRGCRLELIVVDDGCARPVEAELRAIDDERLHVLRVEHGGASRARTAGIETAVGDCFRFIDSDDVLEPGSTARLVACMQGREDVIAYGATLFCDRNLRPEWTMVSRPQGPVLVECLLRRFRVRPFSMVFPRRVVEATGDWDPELRLAHDWDYVLRSLEHATVRGETAVATYYRKHSTSLTGVASPDEARVVEKYFQRHPEQRGTDLERRAHARLQATLARAYATSGMKREAFTAARRSLRLDPSALFEEGRQFAPRVAGRLRSVVRGRGAMSAARR
jgi:glycosyltransferase involved in cell wall biosynthesis